ncbi:MULTISPECIES: IucA/IucC family C-terminal-domain containing protein [Pseudomonas]|uniref:Siderophore-iron reductase, Fe-S cluster protein n=1 Tax=Pseudomonas viridiflava TaxID=33069 RepID=A0AA46VWI4_PSEVI|nr:MULTISPECIES: IucA/IucC family C-terminal-domain containing protein [Pseudomonas]MBI6704929.1 (2Fe-2S)-binding protein [Pseudomonas viridiflava]MBI6725169.1 (2Fe-2S)-binding protein [Pseudomonas viridiflava]QXG28149.1 (2Fe-2S)-binding protein [Pseudomonas viridiflava]UZA69219.1 siderophore-iron reductase, Fe-S cluster protein [Pseudomonas viridiflava]
MTAGQAFSDAEWALLCGPLQLRTAEARDSRSLPAQDLLDEAVCSDLLDALGPVIGSPTRAITASLLAKRFSFLGTGACLYSMSVFDKGLTLSLDNSVIEYAHDDGLWTSSMPLLNVAPFGYATGDRDIWRESIVRTLFAGLLKPLWETFNRVSGISRRILWENTAVRVYSLYEKRMAKVDDPVIRARYEADFDWLLNHADPSLFGLDYNPLKHFRRPPTTLPSGQSIRFRRTCCFYYDASNPVEYCSTCPLLRPKKCR